MTRDPDEVHTCWPPLVIIIRDGLEGYPKPRGAKPLSDAAREGRARGGRTRAKNRERILEEWGEVA